MTINSTSSFRVTSSRTGVTADILHQTLQDMFVTACEGGSNSWLNGVRIGKRPSEETPFPDMEIKAGRWTTYTAIFGGGTLIIQHDQVVDKGPKKTEITLQMMEAGVQLLAEKRTDLFQYVVQVGGGVDANCADSWLQFVVYGEEVFG